MKVIKEISIDNFEFWGGAVDTINRLKELNLTDNAEEFINELYPDGISETTLNDEFWFNASDIYQAVGLDTDGTEYEEEEEEEEEENDWDYEEHINDLVHQYIEENW